MALQTIKNLHLGGLDRRANGDVSWAEERGNKLCNSAGAGVSWKSRVLANKGKEQAVPIERSLCMLLVTSPSKVWGQRFLICLGDLHIRVCVCMYVHMCMCLFAYISCFEYLYKCLKIICGNHGEKWYLKISIFPALWEEIIKLNATLLEWIYLGS